MTVSNLIDFLFLSWLIPTLVTRDINEKNHGNECRLQAYLTEAFPVDRQLEEQPQW